MLDCTKLLKLLCIHILYRLRGLWTDDRKDCSIALYTKQFAAPYSNCVTSEGGSNVALFYCTLYSLREFKHQLLVIFSLYKRNTFVNHKHVCLNQVGNLDEAYVPFQNKEGRIVGSCLSVVLQFFNHEHLNMYREA